MSSRRADRTVEITEKCRRQIWKDAWPDVGVAINEEQREELIRQALVALHLFDLDKHYLIKDGKIQIIDEYTGRLMADRSWERGLHQLIELKEGCKPTARKDTRARISYQRFFRRYLGLAGMTGTAREVAGELWSIYGLKVVSLPTHRPMKRKLRADRVYPDAGRKWEAVVKTVAEVHGKGRPVLVGTRSVEASEQLSGMLDEANLTPPGPERPPGQGGGGDHRAGGAERPHHRGHQYGRPRDRHQARRGRCGDWGGCV